MDEPGGRSETSQSEVIAFRLLDRPNSGPAPCLLLSEGEGKLSLVDVIAQVAGDAEGQPVR
jgi:hypothetical protein